MFVLVELEEKVRVPPHWFGGATELQAIGAELNRRHANRVLPKLGLAICVYDLLALEDGFVYPGEGAYHAKVDYRLLVFRPFVGEVLTGRIRRITPEGLQVSLDFYEDVFIPGHRLQAPSQYKEEEKCWVWKYTDDSGGEFDLDMNLEDEIRFRVERIDYHPPPPRRKPFEQRPPGLAGPGASDPPAATTATQTLVDSEHSAPMTIQGLANEPGLGLVSWWT